MELRVIAATNFGSTAAFSPAFEAMEFGRPLIECENVLICLIQLIKPGHRFPADSVQVSARLLQAALDELDWDEAALDAATLGLEHALRAQLDRIESHYRCTCGATWQDTWWRAEEDRCLSCYSTCLPRACGSLRRVFPGKLPLDDEQLDVLDLA